MTPIQKELLKTSERISKYLMGWYKKNTKSLSRVFAFIEGKRDTLSKKDKAVLSEFWQFIRFYEGKVVAYTFVLQELAGGRFQITKKTPNYLNWMAQTDVKFTCTEPDCPLNQV